MQIAFNWSIDITWTSWFLSSLLPFLFFLSCFIRTIIRVFLAFISVIFPSSLGYRCDINIYIYILTCLLQLEPPPLESYLYQKTLFAPFILQIFYLNLFASFLSAPVVLSRLLLAVFYASCLMMEGSVGG